MMHDRSCSGGRAVVDDEDVESLLERENGTNNFLDILLLVVGRDDNNTVAGMHNDFGLSLQM